MGNNVEKKENGDIFEYKPALGRLFDGDVNRIIWNLYGLGIKPTDEEIRKLGNVENLFNFTISVKDKISAEIRKQLTDLKKDFMSVGDEKITLGVSSKHHINDSLIRSSKYNTDRRNYMEMKIDMWNRKKINDEIPRPIMLGFPEIAQNQEWQVDKYFLGDHARKSVRPTKDWDELQYIACSNGVHHVIGNGKIVLVCSIQIKK